MVSKVPGPEDTIKFMLNTKEFIYTVNMFCDILYLPVETPDNPFVAPVNIETIEVFMNRVGYQGVVDKKFLEIPKRIEEDYHSIKDDIPLVSMYTTGSTPRAHRTPTLTASPQEKKKKQSARESSSPQKSLKITIRQQKVVEGYKDDDDSEDRLEPESHKDKPEFVDDDDDKVDEKVVEEEGGEMGSLETRIEKMQTPIPTPPRSPRKILSSDKNITQELTETNMEQKCVTTKQFWKTHKQVNQVLHLGVSQLAEKATEELIETNLKPCIATTVIEYCDAFHSEVPNLVS
ncbi:hypothetical protein Tco_0088283 [Tanacetum coccineum]